MDTSPLFTSEETETDGPAHPKLLSWSVESHCYLSNIKSHTSAYPIGLHLGCSHASASSDSAFSREKKKTGNRLLENIKFLPLFFPKAMSEPRWPAVLKTLESWTFTDDSFFPLVDTLRVKKRYQTGG